MQSNGPRPLTTAKQAFCLHTFGVQVVICVQASGRRPWGPYEPSRPTADDSWSMCVSVYIYICMHRCIYVYMHMYVHIYIYIFTYSIVFYGFMHLFITCFHLYRVVCISLISMRNLAQHSARSLGEAVHEFNISQPRKCHANPSIYWPREFETPPEKECIIVAGPGTFSIQGIRARILSLGRRGHRVPENRRLENMVRGMLPLFLHDGAGGVWGVAPSQVSLLGF